jgi:hypothetical protein
LTGFSDALDGFITTVRLDAWAAGFGGGFFAAGAVFFVAGFAAAAFLTLVALGADFFAAMLRSR